MSSSLVLSFEENIAKRHDIMELPDEPSPKKKNGTADTRLVSYCHVNVGFDEDSPQERFANVRRESLQSGKSVTLFLDRKHSNGNASHHCEPIREEIENFRSPKKGKLVVKVRDGVKQYGTNGMFVLDGFNMNVEEGTIYTLLGASGCGKTTALSCILGIKHLRSGSVSVFGKPPGSKNSGVPGNLVGYMPQEICLYGDFSIDETLRYYGALYGMKPEEVKASRDFLMPFLDLPDETRRVSRLSLGQQRRVSLAVSLVHAPPLLILDEPTVGTDSLLRQKIWDHLQELVTERKVTCIITTHYLDEAKGSNTIGVMRGGRLLAENDPTQLMRKFNVNALEDVVLKLSKADRRSSVFFGKDGKHQRQQSIPKITESNPKDEIDDDEEFEFSRDRKESITLSKNSTNGPEEFNQSGFGQTLYRTKALVMKNLFVMWRNLFMVLFLIVTPSAMVILICNGIGNDPRPVNLGVVNAEANLTHCKELLSEQNYWKLEGIEEEDRECDVELLSCKYLDGVPKENIVLREYETVEEAIDAVKVGKIWGYISFPEGYSDNVYVRASSGNIIDDAALNGSFITYQLDMTSKQISGYIEKSLADAYEEFIKILLSNCGFNVKLGERPVKSLDPIYGNSDTALREFMGPSLLIGFLFFFPLCSSSVQYIYDKKLGSLDRSRVAGVHLSEILVAFFLTEAIVLTIQLILSLAILVFLFGFEIKGSLPLLCILYILMGLGGVSTGFLFSSFCTEEIQAVLLAMASFFPNFLLSGLLWPTEGMPQSMQYVTYVLPCTFAGESVRSIISRGWGFTHIKVWPGFATIILWIGVYWICTILIHRVVLRRR